jgi:hypothetical protein
MNKLISTVIITTFTAVCSFGAIAGSHDSDKNKETMRKDSSATTSKKDEEKYGKQPSSTSEIMKEKMPDSVSPGVREEYRDQEIMNKKPYKQE